MIIKTKLKPPALKSRMLFRKDLIERFCAAKNRPLFLLSGPAGSGKTSLVRQWVKQEGINVAWYSLDEEDNETEIFFRYTLFTLIQTDEKLSETLGPILANQQKIAGEDIIPQLIESLCSTSHDIYLILDDFHHITSRDIHAPLA